MTVADRGINFEAIGMKSMDEHKGYGPTDKRWTTAPPAKDNPPPYPGWQPSEDEPPYHSDAWWEAKHGPQGWSDDYDPNWEPVGGWENSFVDFAPWGLQQMYECTPVAERWATYNADEARAEAEEESQKKALARSLTDDTRAHGP